MLNSWNSTQTKAIEKTLNILACTIYGEARGEYSRLDGGLSSLIAVGNVILNRANYPERFGKTIDEVCLKPYQFSCWNKNDPNSKVINSSKLEKTQIFNLCQQVAEMIFKKTCPDLTRNSDHYYAIWLKSSPSWAYGYKPTVQIGQHLFFKIVN